MKSRNLTKYSYVLFVLILIACLTISIISFVAPQQTAFADSEYGARLVNFNQLAKYTPNTYNIGGINVNIQDYNFTINNGTSSSINASETFCHINLINGHTYYLVGAFFQVYQNGVFKASLNDNVNYLTWNNAFIYNNTNDNYTLYCNCFIVANTQYETTTFNIKVIDLTKMYGDNLPNLQQCNDLFVAEYYYYNLGEPMYEYSLSSMGSLGELYKTSYTIYSSDWLKNDVYETYTRQNTTTGYTEIYTDILSSDEVRLASVIYTFATRVPAGAILTFDFTNLTCTGNVNIYSNDEGGQFLLYLGTRTQPSNSKTKIVTTSAVMQIQLLFGGTGINTPTISYENLTITAEYITTQNELIEGAYASGQQAMKDYYTSPNAGYQEIFNLGKNYGQRLAEQTAGATTGNAWDFISSTLTSLGSFFSIELMPNVTLGTFIAIPLLFGVLFFILKITRGE